MSGLSHDSTEVYDARRPVTRQELIDLATRKCKAWNEWANLQQAVAWNPNSPNLIVDLELAWHTARDLDTQFRKLSETFYSQGQPVPSA